MKPAWVVWYNDHGRMTWRRVDMGKALEDLVSGSRTKDEPDKGEMGGKGKFHLPVTHVAAMVSPEGFSCATCEYVDPEEHECNNPDYIEWNGGDRSLPNAPLEQICSDWWSPA